MIEGPMLRHLCGGIYVKTWVKDDEGDDEAERAVRRVSHIGRCHYCDRRVFAARDKNWLEDETAVATKDHKIPESRGGTETLMACLRCNGVRGDAPYELFLHWSLHVNTLTDGKLMRKAFWNWLHSLAVERFRELHGRSDQFSEDWSPPAMAHHEAPRSRGRYGLRALRRGRMTGGA